MSTRRPSRTLGCTTDIPSRRLPANPLASVLLRRSRRGWRSDGMTWTACCTARRNSLRNTGGARSGTRQKDRPFSRLVQQLRSHVQQLSWVRPNRTQSSLHLHQNRLRSAVTTWTGRYTQKQNSSRSTEVPQSGTKHGPQYRVVPLRNRQPRHRCHRSTSRRVRVRCPCTTRGCVVMRRVAVKHLGIAKLASAARPSRVLGVEGC